MKWRRIVGWTLASLTALLVIGALAGYFYLRSSGFQEFALRRIITQVEQSTGGRAQIRAFDFELSTLTAHLYDIVVRGKESADSPPLLQIDKLTVVLKIQSAIRRQVSLGELLIEHPVIHLQVDQNGNSNVPQAPPQNSGSNTSVFDLAVRHVALSNGEIDYNDRKTPLDADLHDLRTDIRFELLAKSYRGSISYANGHLHYDKYAPLPHGFNASFTATPSLFRLDSAVITVASSAIKLAADVINYSAPTAQGNYEISLHTQDATELLPTVRPAGNIALKGTFHYQNAGDRSFLRSIRIDGQMGSEVLAAVVSSGRLEIRNFRGQYQIADGSLHTRGIEAETLGGRLNASLDMEDLDGTPTSHLRASARAVSLSSAQRTFRRPELKPVAISGTLDGTTEASWTGSISNVRARVDAVLRSAGKNPNNPSAKDIPIDGAIHALYDGPKSVLTLHQTSLRIPATSVTAEGEISNHSRLEIQANSSDLHRLVELASAFYPMQAGPLSRVPRP